MAPNIIYMVILQKLNVHKKIFIHCVSWTNMNLTGKAQEELTE